MHGGSQLSNFTVIDTADRFYLSLFWSCHVVPFGPYLKLFDLPDVCRPTFGDFQRDERHVTNVYLLAAW